MNKNITSAVIMANGEPSFHRIALDALRNAPFIVCCDGAIQKLEALGFAPDALVGDMDSIDEERMKKYASVIHLNPSEEICDFQKSILFCKNHGINDITILGAMGMREDHALANMSIMMMYAKDLNMRMITNYGVFTPIYKTTSFSSFKGQQVSVFAFDKVKITYHNLRYPVENKEFKYLWEGSLNEALGDEFTVEFEEGAVLVYQTH